MTPLRRFADAVLTVPIKLGIVPNTYLLTTRGRKTGKQRTNPVTLVERDGKRWLVAPYGPVGWVHNARAAGEVRLRRRGTDTVWRVREAGPEEAAPVLKAYLKITGPPRLYFEAGPNSPESDFVAEAPKHPVFELLPAERGD